MKNDKDKLNELITNFLSEALEIAQKEQLEKGEITQERADISKEKLELMTKKAILESQLGEVTDNDYVEIGKILNDLFRKENELLKEAYAKCKKWLDDNNKPYKTPRKNDDEKI